MGKATGGTTTGTQSSTNTVNTGPWKPQQPYLEDAFAKAQAQYGDNASKTYFPTSTVQPFNANQTIALNDILGVGANPNVGAASQLNLDTLSGKYLSPDSNPWLKATYDQGADAASRQYMTATAPQTAGATAAAGRYGSGAYRNLVSGNEQNLGKTLGNLATDIYGGNYQTERNRQMSAIGNAPMLAQADYINPLMRLQAGDRQQQQGQAETTDAVNRYNYNRDAGTNALNTYIGQIQGNYGQSGTTATQGTTQTPYYSNPMSSILGGALGLGSLFSGGSNSAASGIGSLLSKSDRRAKTDIRKIGVTSDGQNIYSFRYIGSPRTEVGLMAQEVEKVHPEAVVEVNGVKFVDYGLALKDAA